MDDTDRRPDGRTGAWLWRWDGKATRWADSRHAQHHQALLAAVNPWSPDGAFRLACASGTCGREHVADRLAVWRLGDEGRIVGPPTGARRRQRLLGRDGNTIYYELADRSDGDATWTKANGRIWLVSADAGNPPSHGRG